MSTITRSDRAPTRNARPRKHATSLLALALAVPLALSPSLAQAENAPAPAPAPEAAPDPLASLRERFREGWDKYKSGAFAEAIVIWESIYRDLGHDKGYRLAYDLARAYDELGDLNKAAEHYETYLDRVAARRSEGELLEPNVEKQATVARERSEKISSLKSRIRVKASARPVIVHIDNAAARVAGFTVYVEPGPHTVTFGEGRDADVRRVTLKGGELVDIDPREDVAAPQPFPTRWETRVDRPFSSTVLWVGAGVALVSLVVPVITYANALSIKSEYDAASTSSTDKTRLSADYESARSNAYASIVVPALFTATVATLALSYVLGTKETRVPISVSPTSAALGFDTSF